MSESVNSLPVARPDIALQWSSQNTMHVTEVGIYSRQECLWVGTCGHTFKASVKAMATNRAPRACYECVPSVHKRKRRTAKLDVSHPEIAAEWHPTKNGDLTPGLMSPGSDKFAWWLGKCGHEWDARVFSRTGKRSSGCPVCSGRRVLAGFNDLGTTHPELLEWWHPSKNTDVSPREVTAGSGIDVHWQCPECVSVWVEPVNMMVRKKLRCADCRGGYAGVSVGVNDLDSQREDLAVQWHPTKNGERTPLNTTVASGYNAWWKCSEDVEHEWRTPVYARSRSKGASGCPHCNARKTSSQGEEEVLKVLGLLGVTQMQTSVRSVTKGELDIYIPEKNVAIEFNGLYWHSEASGKDRNYHLRKTVAAAEKGIHLIHIWEDEWRDHRDIVVRDLAYHLDAMELLNTPGVLIEPNPSLVREYLTEDLTPEVLPRSISKTFMAENHYQGASSGTLHIGLRDKNRALRAGLVVTRTSHGQWRIERYAVRGRVPDGFTQLLEFAEAHIRSEGFKDFAGWVIYADRAICDGDLYRDAGFVEDGHLRPDYQYVVRGERVPKSKYTRERFKTDPTLEYDSHLSEKALADLNKLPRIWDSGKTRWVKLLTKI